MSDPAIPPFPVAPPSQLPGLRRVLVANRGEIAVRVVRACQSLGVEAVVAVSDADVDSLAVRLADHHIRIGEAAPASSYLSISRLVAAALAAGCDAVHPGYGFLSERADFAQACVDAGLVFIGPDPMAMAAMADKIVAARLATDAGVPCVPGTPALADPQAAADAAEAIGWPALLKSSAGGGGRGMRIVQSPEQLPAAFASARAEALAAFGDGTLYLEKLITRARHIEIQVMADRHGHAVQLGERDCSTQRRHQKLLEESPSPRLSEAQRAEMAQCALALVRKVGYVGAGTVEFVLDDSDGRFYFLEMNTRIQVEHPVTEMVTGLDLVVEQLRIAAGLPLSFTQEEVRSLGHAIECRINAEDPDRNFLPRPGLVTHWQPPVGEGVRCDSHCHDGMLVTPHYDSLLGKLIVHAPTRDQAITRMLAALQALRVEGVPSTAGFHRELLAHPDFLAARVTTRWVEQVFLPQRQRARAAARPA